MAQDATRVVQLVAPHVVRLLVFRLSVFRYAARARFAELPQFLAGSARAFLLHQASSAAPCAHVDLRPNESRAAQESAVAPRRHSVASPVECSYSLLTVAAPLVPPVASALVP